MQERRRGAGFEGFGLRNFSKSENIIKHNCFVKKYPNGKVHLTCFSRDIYTDDGWENRENDNEQGREYNTLNPRDDNIRRARNKVFDIALANEWAYMVTFTLDGKKVDRYNPSEVIKPFTNWLKNMSYRKGLKALIVPELHKDGAIHFHGLCNDVFEMVDSGTVKIPGKKNPVKRSTAEKYGYDLSRPDIRAVYNITNYHLGFSTAVKIDENVESVSKYMTKYVLKDFQKIFGKTYFAVGDIERELPSFMIDLRYQDLPGEEYFLPEKLGSVKYLLIDENAFNELLEEWSRY